MADQSQSDKEVSSISSVDSFDLEKREYEEVEKKVADEIGMGVKNLIAQKNSEILNKK